jgi:DNA repair ATPase RecN
MSDVSIPSVTPDTPFVKDETAPRYQVGGPGQPIDLDAMLREINRRLHGIEQLEADNRALRFQLSHALCQVGAATRLLRLALVSHTITNQDIAEYEERFGRIGEIVFLHE